METATVSRSGKYTFSLQDKKTLLQIKQRTKNIEKKY